MNCDRGECRDTSEITNVARVCRCSVETGPVRTKMIADIWQLSSVSYTQQIAMTVYSVSLAATCLVIAK